MAASHIPPRDAYKIHGELLLHIIENWLVFPAKPLPRLAVEELIEMAEQEIAEMRKLIEAHPRMFVEGAS